LFSHLVFTRLDKGFAGMGMELWGKRGGSQTLRKGQEVSNEFYRGCLKIGGTALINRLLGWINLKVDIISHIGLIFKNKSIRKPYIKKNSTRKP